LKWLMSPQGLDVRVAVLAMGQPANPTTSTGFLTLERLNVLFSRAQSHLFVVGPFATLARAARHEVVVKPREELVWRNDVWLQQMRGWLDRGLMWDAARLPDFRLSDLGQHGTHSQARLDASHWQGKAICGT
jgi:hypothetical protein